MLCAITLPSVTKSEQAIPAQVRINLLEHVEDVLAGAFGGCTTFKGYGCWRGPDGQNVREEITEIRSEAGELDETKRELIERLASTIRDLMQQECVAYTLGNEMHFI